MRKLQDDRPRSPFDWLFDGIADRVAEAYIRKEIERKQKEKEEREREKEQYDIVLI